MGNSTARYVLNFAALAALCFAISVASAQGYGTATGYLCVALNDLCADIRNLIPVAAMLLIVTAAVVYAIGQMFGAETRARATVWATSCLTGAVIGIIIATVAPSILSILANADVTCDKNHPPC